MKQYTHLAVSVGLGAFLLSLFSLLVPLGLIFFLGLLVFFGVGKIPDGVDFKFGEHRRRFLTHSPLSPVWFGVSVAIGLLFSVFQPLLGVYTGAVTYLVLLSHFFLDALNPTGVPLYPNSRRVILAKIPYDHFASNVLFTAIGLLLLGGGFLVFFTTL